MAQDDIGYIWMGTSQGLIKYNSQETEWFKPIANDTLSLPSRKVNDIFCDETNQIWISTNEGLCLFEQSTQQFNRIKYRYEDGSKPADLVNAVLKVNDDNLLIIDQLYFGILNLKSNLFSRIEKNQIQAPMVLHQDHSNRIWIGTRDGDVFRYNPGKNAVKKMISNEAAINCIYSENKQVWIGTEGEGAKLYDLNNRLIKQISFGNAADMANSGHVRVIKKDTYGRLWFGTYEGLYMDDGNKLSRFKPEDYPGLPHNSIYEIFEDQQGGLWFGTWSGGVALIHHSDNNFQTYRQSQSPNSISSNTATAIIRLNRDEMLVGTELGGLNKFNIKSEKFETVRISTTENIRNIKSLCKDKQGGIWVGTFRKGLWYKAPGSDKFKLFEYGPNDGNHISSESVYSLCAVDSGVWIGTFHAGVNFYSFKSKSIRHCFHDRNDALNWSEITPHSIFADSKSNLWIGTLYGAIYKLHIPSGQISVKETREFKEKDESNIIYHFWEHNSGEIWIGTNNNGIFIYNPESNSYRSFDVEGLLTSKSVYAISEDKNNDIWITSNNGLIFYNQENSTTRHFLYSDGIQSNLFYPRSVAHDINGNMYFGGPNGITRIQPGTIKINTRKPYTIINKITTNDNQNTFPVYSQSHQIEKITFQPGENTLRFSFAADNYFMPEKNRYKYRLINYYDDWIDIENEGSVLFASLSPGEYIFEVKACNNDGIWNETPTQFTFEIKKYWYNTNLAYFVYFLVLGSLFYFIIRFYYNQLELRRAVLLEKQQRENEEQMHEMKLKFFTNISHEFRTPLTLISWPIKRLLKANNLNDEQREELEVANRNSNRLLQLINQIIDLRKLEKEKSKLNISRIDVISFIKEMQKDFSLDAKQREIKFILDSSYTSLEIEADKEKLDSILYNLLSNAYKYVPLKGQIKITIDEEISNTSKLYANQLSYGEIHVDDFIAIAIEDNGTGIDNEDLLKIFTRFEQGKQSNKKDMKETYGGGIGLSMCKDYTLLHHGKIIAQSTSGNGSCFTIILPTKQKAQKILFESHEEVKNLKTDEPKNLSSDAKDKSNKSKHILVVEDNKDFSQFITRYLSEFYHVESAINGKEGLEVLKKHNIDLIVSDVMMPKMDGYEFCSIVKTQIETSHIPVILLTALSSSENLIAGLDKGADAYLTKPFEEEALLKQIHNILEQRRRIQENFSKQFVGQNTVDAGSLDSFFLTKVRQVIEQNLLDENFNMESLADELMISRSKLHRKIKSLSGVTTSEFVNLVRLKKAIELIKEKNYRFNEVAFEVGFSSHSYFNRCFKKVYGVTPKEYFMKDKD
ncbi:hypothetical protein LH29_15015 [Draconibacterium sediminis]|uniref:histidine kinase n=2 Tax=Draconibacterium sediminis TaxID=1544798 RepID=A0A0D8JAF8_9BACT|nr:hypothetical protein LH29_15015 [Draconibacterium sediminis]